MPFSREAPKGHSKAPVIDLASLSLGEVMTLLPETIEEDTPLPVAAQAMREGKFRHLPVVRKGKLTGILSDRDVHIASLTSHIEKVSAGDVMTSHPLAAKCEASVLSAVSMMVERKIDSIIVTGAIDDVVGIFTSQDALKLLLGERKHHLPAPSGYPMLDADEEGE